MPARRTRGKAPARYVLGDGASERFWEIELGDTEIKTRYWKRGGEPRTSSTPCPDRRAAERMRAKRINDKTQEGYRLVSEAAPVGAQSRAGVRARDAAIEAMIDAAPDEIDGYLVYADWLQARRDPRGELIALHHALLRDPGSIPLQRKINQLLKAFKADLLGPFADLPVLRLLRSTVTTMSWRLGFVRFLRLWRLASQPSVLPSLKGCLEHPSGRFLRAVAIGASLWEPRNKSDSDFRRAIELIAEHGPASLDTLFVGEAHEDNLTHLGAPWRSFPRLRSLWLHGRHLRVDEPLPAALRRLELCTTDLAAETVEGIAASELPTLEALTLWSLGATPAHVSALEAVLDPACTPKLGHLGLRSLSGNVDAFLPLVATRVRRSTVTPIRRVTLDLGVAGARLLLERASTFDGLDRIALVLTGVDAATITALAERLPNVVVNDFDYTALGFDEAFDDD